MGKMEKIEYMVGTSILIKFSPKIEFGERNLKFRDHLEHQIMKILALEILRWRGPKTENYGVFFCEFCVPKGTFELTNK